MLAAACGSSRASGLRGTAVERSCAGPSGCNHALRAAFRVVDARTGRLVRSFRSDSRGRFRVDLAPGHYLVVEVAAVAAAGRQVPVVVRRNHVSNVKLVYPSPSG